MCDAKAALTTQVFGALNDTVGSFYGARAERRQLQFSADMADINAQFSELSAKDALRKGQRQEQQARLENRNIRDAQTVGFASSNVALDSVSVIQTMTSTEVMGEIDANTIEANAAREAWGYRTDAIMQKGKAASERAAAGAISPFGRASNTLLGSAGTIGMNYYKLKREGAFEPKGSGK